MAVFYNQATLTYSGGVANSNIVSGEIIGTLTAEKTAVGGSYTAGDQVTYIVSLVNSGANSFTDLTVTDDLGAYELGDITAVPLDYVEGTLRYFVNGSLQPAPTVTAGPPLTITGVDVPAGGNVIIIYDARVNGFASPEVEGSITNTVTITGDGLNTPVTAEETIAAEPEARLSITKSLTPTTVQENGEITYTFIIQNSGSVPVTEADAAVISDLFDPILDITSVTFNGEAWTEPENYTYDEITGQFTTVAGQVTVPAATFTQDPESGLWTTTPGVSTLVVTGTV